MMYISEGEAPPKSAELPPPPTYKGKYETEDSDLEEKPLFTGPVPQPPVIEVPDTGRKDDLPQCPIIFVAGEYIPWSCWTYFALLKQ